MGPGSTIRFSNGENCPLLGLGTWKAMPGEVTQAVKDAIDLGYRHFDCAYIYENEAEVGKGIREKIKEGVVKREDLFITSKLWNNKHAKEKVIPALKNSLDSFGLDYLDLYLIHWPVAFKEIPGNIYCKDENGQFITSDEDFTDTWKAMEEGVEYGLVKSIGLSNFNSKQIEAVLEIADIKPVNNQVECHPYLNQKRLLDFCLSKGITMTAYAPLGRPMNNNSHQLLDDPILKSIGAKYHKSVAQVAIRYQLQRNIIVIPKSIRKERLIENIDVYNFNLADEDMAAIDGINKNLRLVTFEELNQHKHYPFSLDF